MGSALNPDTYGQSTTGNANQIEDGVDFPHSGIIKALSDGMGQNYAIDGFDISSTNATALTVAAGKIFRDGQLVSVSGASLTLSSTYTNGYHLLVAPSGSTPTVVLRNPSAVDKVPDITSGDTIIAVITHTGVNPCSIQFLTVHKREHSLSIGRNNSSVYTEGLTIKSNAGDIEFESLETDKDIIFKVKDGSSVVDRLILYGDNDPTFPNTEVKIEGSLLATEDIQANKISLGYGNSPTSGLAEIRAYSPSEPMVFKTGSAAERMRIDTVGKIGIGTASPQNKLHVSHTGADGDNGIIIVREDSTTADTDLLGGIGFDSTDGNVPSSVLEASAYIAALAAEDHGTGDKGADLTFGTAAIDENDDTVSTEHMRILSDGKVGIGTNAPLHTFHAVDRTNNFPYRFEVSEGNLRINKFGHLQIQNENSGDANATSFDDPFWQIAQRDTGELDIAFGTPGTGNAFVGANDDIISMKRDSNSATGAKQIGFLGATAVSRPAAPSAVSSIASSGGAAPADPEANADAINALITALTNLGLIG